MRTSRTTTVTAFFAVTNFFLLSHFSNYRFDNLQSYNWDIALMLTPYGIIKNLWLETGSYLEPYYFASVQLPPEHSFFPVAIFIAVQVVLSMALLILLEKARRWVGKWVGR